MRNSQFIAIAVVGAALVLSSGATASTPAVLNLVHAASVGETSKVAALVHYDHDGVLRRLATSGVVAVEVRYAIGNAHVSPDTVTGSLAPSQELVLIGEVDVQFDGEIVIGTAITTMSIGQASWQVKQPVVFLKTPGGIEVGTTKDWLQRHQGRTLRQQTPAEALMNLEPGDVPGEGRGRTSIPCGPTQVCLGGDP